MVTRTGEKVINERVEFGIFLYIFIPCLSLCLFTCYPIVAWHVAWLHRWHWDSSKLLCIHPRLEVSHIDRFGRESVPLPGFFPSWEPWPAPWAASFKSPSSMSRECCLDSSDVLGLWRFALWPPARWVSDIFGRLDTDLTFLENKIASDH